MAYWVYILECTDKAERKTYYTGYTNNLFRRFREHSGGRGAKYTRGKDVVLKYFETHPSQGAAMRRELEIKRLPRAKKVELITSASSLS
ncbi:MAG: GIY-YIG nuclease family protein [Promethearchaeota archaeon]